MPISANNSESPASFISPFVSLYAAFLSLLGCISMTINSTADVVRVVENVRTTIKTSALIVPIDFIRSIYVGRFRDKWRYLNLSMESMVIDCKQR